MPMSTGQPPSDNASGGGKPSKPGQAPLVSAAGRSEGRRPPALSVDEGWDLREAPTAAERPSSAGPPLAPSSFASPPRPSGAPASGKGKFTVGNLLNASQGAPAATHKRNEIGGAHRQQIGALPKRSAASHPATSTQPSPVGAAKLAVQSPVAVASPAPKRTPKSAGATAPVQPPAPSLAPSHAGDKARTTPPQFAAVNPHTALERTTPSPPFAAAWPERTTPSQPFAAVPPAAVPERTTPSQPFAAVPPAAVPERTTPKQPFPAAAPVGVVEQKITSQPFTALASPMVSLEPPLREAAGEQAAPPRVQVSPRATPGSALAARDLLEPDLHEKTPKGIGIVTLSPPAPASAAAESRESTGLSVAPIIPIATVRIVEPGLVEPTSVGPLATANDSLPATPAASPFSEPAIAEMATAAGLDERRVADRSAHGPVGVSSATPLPLPTTIESRPPPAAPVLDDPDGWEVSGETAIPSVTAAPPPVASGAAAEPSEEVSWSAERHDSAARLPAAGAAENQRGASKGKLKASKPEAGSSAGITTPSSHSKLLRAGHAETELSGEFFAVSLVDAAPDSAAFRDADVIIDERHRRSLSPEVVARRARYRVVVVLVVVGFLVLLGAAIALEMLHRR